MCVGLPPSGETAPLVSGGRGAAGDEPRRDPAGGGGTPPGRRAAGGPPTRLRGRAGQFESAAETVPVTYLLSRMARRAGDRVPIPDVDVRSLLFEMCRVWIRAQRSRSRRPATTATKR